MNPPSVEELTNAVGKEAGDELDGALRKIKHCVNQLDDDQLWWRSSDDMNSIANLILHLCGNVRQWIIAGVGGTEDTRSRNRTRSIERCRRPNRDRDLGG